MYTGGVAQGWIPRKLTIDDRVKGEVGKVYETATVFVEGLDAGRVKPRGQDPKLVGSYPPLSSTPSGWATVTIAKLHRSNDRNSSSWNACTLSEGRREGRGSLAVVNAP